MSGTLYGIGTGPGDPELLTIKALNIIRRTDILAIPSEDEERCLAYRTVRKILPQTGNKQLLKLPFPMTGDKLDLRNRHRRYADILEEYLDAGSDVAFLTIGDPSVYSTYGYLHRILLEDGYAAQMVSGIPSFCAAAATLGEILCEGEETLEIIPAAALPDSLSDTSLTAGGTKIFMKVSSRSADIAAALKKSGRSASMVQNCGSREEKIYRDAGNFPDNPGYFTIILSRANDGSCAARTGRSSSDSRPRGTPESGQGEQADDKKGR